MNITDIQQCADFYQENYLKTFYLIVTYNGTSFILIGEKKNFPHLMGIRKEIYKSNGYNNPKKLYNDIISRKEISKRIIPNNISTTSKMYQKAKNFTHSIDIFWKNDNPLTVNYDPAKSKSKLDNVDVLLTDISSGYMLGWVKNKQVLVNENISIKKYCICTWIDESEGGQDGKEKYMSNQDIELIRYVFAFNEKSNLIRKKEYSYDREQKISILQSCERNNCNLLVDSRNAHHYVEIALQENIHCKINDIQY